MIPGKRGLYAKGRMKAGAMNKTEAEYAKYLEHLKYTGRIAAYWFEAMKLKVADGACWYTPDFLVMRNDGTMELHEVKGSPRIFQDDAKVKVKAVSTHYPFKAYVVYPRRKQDGGGWDTVEF